MSIKNMITKYAKAWTALAISAFTATVAQGTLPDQYQRWGIVAVAVLTALGVRQVPNKAPQ